MSTYEIWTLGVQAAGIAVVGVYTWLTYRMANAAEENIRLTREIQAETSFPIIALSVESTQVHQHAMGQLETIFRLHNTSKYNAKAWVTVDTFLDGQQFDWSAIQERKYSGVDPWAVPAHLQVTGHFDFSRIYPSPPSVAGARVGARQGNAVPSLVIVVKYRWTDQAGTRFQEGMEQRWHYDFNAWVWVLDI